jgi:hypothetical protein
MNPSLRQTRTRLLQGSQSVERCNIAHQQLRDAKPDRHGSAPIFFIHTLNHIACTD